MPLKTGVYFIKNVQAKNLAYLPNPDSEEPVQCRYHRNDPGEQWEVIDRKNGQHSIVNIGHKTYATSGFRSPAGTPVVGRQSEQTWIIQKANNAGQYTISTTDTQKFWGVVDIQLGTPITLADVPTNPFNWWTFEDVKTGIDAEVATDDMVSRAVFLFELVPPPISSPKSYKLDFVVIQETPNNFIRNIIETTQKICRPLISSGQLDLSDLLIQGIEFESFQKAHRFRVFGPDSFEKLRHYRGADWTECSGPVIPTFLTKGLNGFRPSAMKVVVLNLGHIPLQSGGELRLSQVIRKMANEDVIMILTLSEPHLPDALFETELFQELARVSTSIHSLPVDGGHLYSCIVDYLQNFDVDSIKTKFPNVATVNLEIPLSQRSEKRDEPGITAKEPLLVILRLQVLGCLCLMEEELWRGPRDFYVVVNFLNNRGETPVAKGTSSPSYAAKDATFDFPIYLSLANRLGVIEFVVWNKNALKQLKDECIGKVTIPLEDWFNDRDYPFDHPEKKPFMLNVISTRTGRSAGRMSIKLGFAHASLDHRMEFPQIYKELLKQSRPSLASGPPVRSTCLFTWVVHTDQAWY